MAAGQQEYPKVSMMAFPVSHKAMCTEDKRTEARPAVPRAAGQLFFGAVLFFSLLFLLLNPVSAFAANCSGTEVAGPEMVQIPAGSYRRGSPVDEQGRDEDEGPQQTVAVASFALAVCEVTVAEYRRFAEVTQRPDSEAGCFHGSAVGETDWELRPEFNWRNALYGEQAEDHPVVCVSWQDAMDYAAWLTEQVGLGQDEQYRLPTEAEWEYAARAGSTQARYYGERQQCLYANGLDDSAADVYGTGAQGCDDGAVHTAPVGSYTANPWGLKDMLGNVYDWTADCRHANYQNAPSDGGAWLAEGEGDCDRRVLRGGAWSHFAEDLRSAFRSGNSTDFRSVNVGFRLARTPVPLASDL